MQYQSIIRLFEYCNVDCNHIDAGRIKKILSAEFSITTNGIITIDGFDYNKNDILQELERDDFAQRLDNHKKIWEIKSLLVCLEKNIIDFSEVYQWIKLKNNEQFVSFISPHFATTFDVIMRKLLNSLDFENADRWLRILDFINNPDDEDKALASTRLFISDSIRMLKNANNVTYIYITPQLELWVQLPCYLLLNDLPPSLSGLKDDLVKALVNFTVTIQHANKNLCYQVSCQLVKIINIDSNLYDLIHENHKIYKSKVSPAPPERSRWTGGRILKFVFIGFILLNVIRIVISDFSSGSENKKDTISYANLSNFFIRNREAFSVIDTGSIASNKNIDEILAYDQIYYVIYEGSNPNKGFKINILNKSKFPIAIYVPDSENSVIDFGISPSEGLSLACNKSNFDFLFRISGSDLNKSMLNEVLPFLISDSLDLSNHNIVIDNSRKTLNVDVLDTFNTMIPTMIIYTTPNITLNCMTFQGNVNWVATRKNLSIIANDLK